MVVFDVAEKRIRDSQLAPSASFSLLFFPAQTYYPLVSQRPIRKQNAGGWVILPSWYSHLSTSLETWRPIEGRSRPFWSVSGGRDFSTLIRTFVFIFLFMMEAILSSLEPMETQCHPMVQQAFGSALLRSSCRVASSRSADYHYRPCLNLICLPLTGWRRNSRKKRSSKRSRQWQIQKRQQIIF